MPTFLLATLAASVIGSLHCAGMCGPFVLMAAGTSNRPRRLAAYHGGRLLSYAALGAVAGSAGAAFDLGGRAVGLQRAAAFAAGGLMIAFGLAGLVRAFGGYLPHFSLPGTAQRWIQAGYRATKLWPPTARAAAIGGLSALLPCGWLFLFVLAAAGTGSGLGGAALTTAFWLGTLPILTAVVAGAAKLTGRFRRALPFATASICIAAGGHTMLVRADVDLRTLSPVAGASVENISDLPGKPLPCCHGRNTAAPR